MNPSPTLSEVVEQYLAYRATRYSPATVRGEGHVLRRFVDNLGDPRVKAITPETIEGWFAAIMRPHTDRAGVQRPAVTATTCNYYRARIASLSRYCVARGLTRSDWLAHSPHMREHRRIRQQPSPDVLFAMLDSAIDPRDRAVLALAMNTGLRASEISALKVGDLDLGSLTLRVRITKSRLEDDMPVTADLAREMERWLRHYAKAIGRPLIAEDYLVCAHSGPRIRWRKGPDGQMVREMTENVLNPTRPVLRLERIAQDALRAVGLETKHEGIHTLRRATARALYESLKSDGHETAIRVVMTFLHHTNQSTTETYLGVTGERQARDLSLRGRSFLQRSSNATVTPITRKAAR